MLIEKWFTSIISSILLTPFVRVREILRTFVTWLRLQLWMGSPHLTQFYLSLLDSSDTLKDSIHVFEKQSCKERWYLSSICYFTFQWLQGLELGRLKPGANKGPKRLDHLPLAPLVYYQGSSRTWSNTCMGCLHHRQRLNPMCHNAASSAHTGYHCSIVHQWNISADIYATL